jgi:hypothetical protein
MDLRVGRLDNLGIVAGITKELGIIDFINERLRDDVRSEISIYIKSQPFNTQFYKNIFPI